MPASLTRSAYPAPAATLSAAIAAFGRRAWAVLVRVGEQRAAGELERLAALYAHTQPELARQLRQSAGTPR